MNKIALFGGTFDPLTEAHVEIAKTILNNEIADEFWFSPTITNWYRSSDGILDICYEVQCHGCKLPCLYTWKYNRIPCKGSIVDLLLDLNKEGNIVK